MVRYLSHHIFGAAMVLFGGGVIVSLLVRIEQIAGCRNVENGMFRQWQPSLLLRILDGWKTGIYQKKMLSKKE